MSVRRTLLSSLRNAWCRGQRGRRPERVCLGALCAVTLALLPQLAAAEEPVLRVEVSETEAVPGQPVSLRLTVLVPTFMPDPPVWPSFEAPNLAVRVASTGPTSEQVDGETWSGVTRRYQLSPMVPGAIALPAQSVGVTWAGADSASPQTSELPTEPLTLTGIVPEGAEGIDPFLAADGLDLSQSVDGETEGLTPGASVVREVTATIQGTAPMFLPALLPPHQVDGMRAYPDAPVLEEREERGVLSGSRTERVTLVAEGGGQGEAPAISLRWYNLRTSEVETASVEAIPLSVTGPPASSTAPSEPRDWRTILLTGVAGLLSVGAIAMAWRYAVPPVCRLSAARRAAWIGSESYAYRALLRVVEKRDFAALFPALDLWADRVPGGDPRRDPRLEAALTSLGAARYALNNGDTGAGWQSLRSALSQVRGTARQRQGRSALPPLNPGALPPV